MHKKLLSCCKFPSIVCVCFTVLTMGFVEYVPMKKVAVAGMCVDKRLSYPVISE